ncbi:unnamed protein product [Albugo candida]|uniref:Nucleoporin NDC1 n=1 Tax=Albugo candida TaxID=65357 RepID=A0A024GET6_9STRA|nr:unnamed protein product [Albugo candida]|eukprot:CCI45030.1 unnamed protein product [Albugo candida]
MGILHTWEVLQALQYFFQRSTFHGIKCNNAFDLIDMAWPYPFFQIHIRQALRGLIVLLLGSVTIPLLLLCWIGSMMTHQDFKFIQCLLTCTFLGVLSFLFVLVRFIVLPTPRRYEFLFSPIRVEFGFVEAVVTSFVHASMQFYQEPQLMIIWALSIAHSWVWKWAMRYLLTDDFVVPDGMGVILCSCISTYLFLSRETYFGTSPMQANAFVTLKAQTQRHALQCWRCALIGYPTLVFFGSLSQHAPTRTWLSCVSYILSSFFELFSQLCAMSLLKSSFYRTWAFERNNDLDRTRCWQVLLDWARDNLYRLNKEFPTLQSLFIAKWATGIAIETENPSKHYVVALQERMKKIRGLLAIGEIGQKPAFSLTPIDFQALDNLEASVWINEVKKISQFRSHWRKDLYLDSESWNACFSITTGILDSFTLSLQTYTDLFRQHGEDEDEKSKELEKSVAALIRFMNHQSNIHPLILLDRNPHLANLRIASCQTVSKLRGFVNYHLQFAIRACLLHQARDSVFFNIEEVLQTQYTLGSLLIKSRREDTQGSAKHTIAAALCSLMDCQSALESYLSHYECSQLDSTQFTADIVVLQRGIEKTLARLLATFQNEMKAFSLPSSVWKKLQDFVDVKI